MAGLEAARAAFYCGDIAQAIVAYHEEHGGYLTREDMASFRSRYESPVTVRWRDMEVITCGPWCQGPVVAQTLRMAERAGLDGLAWDSPEYAHLLLELLKGSFADRERQPCREAEPHSADSSARAQHVEANHHAIERSAVVQRERVERPADRHAHDRQVWWCVQCGQAPRFAWISGGT